MENKGKMRERDYWAYGAGVLGIAAISQLISQLSYFYTDKVGMVNSASSFGAKVGGGIGSGLIGWVLGVFGYVSQATEQTASAIQGVLVISNWIPGVMVAMMLILMLLYDIDKKYPHFREQLHNGRTREENAK